MPSNLNEQEEFAKEWAHKPRCIALFLEPSSFAYVSQQLLPATLDEHLLPLLLCLHLALSPYGGTSAKLMGTITLLISAMLSCESLSSWSLFSLSYSSLSHLIFPFQSSISPFSVFCPCIDKSSHCQCSRSRII